MPFFFGRLFCGYWYTSNCRLSQIIGDRRANQQDTMASTTKQRTFPLKYKWYVPNSVFTRNLKSLLNEHLIPMRFTHRHMRFRYLLSHYLLPLPSWSLVLLFSVFDSFLVTTDNQIWSVRVSNTAHLLLFLLHLLQIKQSSYGKYSRRRSKTLHRTMQIKAPQKVRRI